MTHLANLYDVDETDLRRVSRCMDHAHQWDNYLHTASVLVRQPQQHHCKLCSGCGRLMCEVTPTYTRGAKNMTLRPGYHFDNHKRLVGLLRILMDEAATGYDQDEDVVDDFTQYLKDWANRRSEDRPGRPEGI